jgi:hypothetical protein
MAVSGNFSLCVILYLDCQHLLRWLILVLRVASMQSGMFQHVLSH